MHVPEVDGVDFCRLGLGLLVELLLVTPNIISGEGAFLDGEILKINE